MTTPKDDKTVYIPATLEDVARGVVAIRKALDKPNEPMRELAEEFRRLAVETGRVDPYEDAYIAGELLGIKSTWEQAAQMLEERLDGS